MATNPGPLVYEGRNDLYGEQKDQPARENGQCDSFIQLCAVNHADHKLPRNSDEVLPQVLRWTDSLNKDLRRFVRGVAAVSPPVA